MQINEFNKRKILGWSVYFKTLKLPLKDNIKQLLKI